MPLSHATNQSLLKAVENFDHVIWDWNGTLVDDVDVAVAAVNAMLFEGGMPLIDAATYRRIFGFPVRDYYLKLGFDFKKVSFEALCDQFMLQYNRHRNSHAKLFVGVPAVLAEIKKTRMQSILSAAEQVHLNEITEHYQIHENFNHRYGIEDYYASSKLKRGHELVGIAGVSKEKTILIGDTDHDFEVAHELGISCLLVADGHQTLNRLQHHTPNIIYGRRHYET